MTVVPIVASVPTWIMDAVREAAGDRPVAEALGFGLQVMFGIAPVARRQLAEVLAAGPEEPLEDLEVRFAGVDERFDPDMPLTEIVETAAAIAATVALDPEARADFLKILHGEDGLQ